MFDPGPPDHTRVLSDEQKLHICKQLRPCPFCGTKPGTPDGVWIWLRGIGHIAVCCHVCRFMLYDDREEKIIAYWNLRDGIQDMSGSWRKESEPG